MIMCRFEDVNYLIIVDKLLLQETLKETNLINLKEKKDKRDVYT